MVFLSPNLDCVKVYFNVVEWKKNMQFNLKENP